MLAASAAGTLPPPAAAKIVETNGQCLPVLESQPLSADIQLGQQVLLAGVYPGVYCGGQPHKGWDQRQMQGTLARVLLTC